jgi:hypothetical protein
MTLIRYFVLALFFITAVQAVPKKVHLFVALCDNASQGIMPVPAKIGDGDKPAANLYWGCSDGVAGCFQGSKGWRLIRTEKPEDPRILERRFYQDAANTVELIAEAWRGREIAACLRAYETALVSGEHDLCAYIGHNVLMEAEISPPTGKAKKPCDAIVLCCQSEPYFRERLEKLGVRPVLLTRQLMYPGAFLLRESLPTWAQGKPLSEVRDRAVAAYAKNQKISVKSASSVFSVLEKKVSTGER